MPRSWPDREHLFTRTLYRARDGSDPVRTRGADSGEIPRGVPLRPATRHRGRRPDRARSEIGGPARAGAPRAALELHARRKPADRPARELQRTRVARRVETNGAVTECATKS